MNKHLEMLIKIAKIDKEMDLLEAKLNPLKASLKKCMDNKEGILQKIIFLQESIKNLDSEIMENERKIAENQEKLINNSKKQKDIRTEREMIALNVEEDVIKEGINNANIQIERIQKTKQQHIDEITQNNEKLSKLDEEIAAHEVSINEKSKEIQQEQKKLYVQKEKINVDADQKTMSFYQKIRRWAKNTSVVPIYKKACGGCFIRVSDKTYLEVKEQDTIVNCPHCGRILYFDEKLTIEHEQEEETKKATKSKRTTRKKATKSS